MGRGQCWNAPVRFAQWLVVAAAGLGAGPTWGIHEVHSEGTWNAASTAYEIVAPGGQYYTRSYYTSDSHDSEFTSLANGGLRVSDGWVKYCFQLPTTLHKYLLIDYIDVVISRGPTDTGCGDPARTGCDSENYEVTCQILNPYVQATWGSDDNYGHLATLGDVEAGNSVERAYKVAPWFQHLYHYTHPSEPSRLWLKIDAPDGIRPEDADDDADVEINSIRLVVHVKRRTPPALSLVSPETLSNGKANVRAGEAVAYTVVDPDGTPEGYTARYYWKKGTAAAVPALTDDFEGPTSEPVRSVSFAAPGDSVVYCKVMYESQDASLSWDRARIYSEILAISVRAWDPPTVSVTPSDSTEVSWFAGKYVGVAGQPVRLMAGGEAASSGQGDTVETVVWDFDGNWNTVELEGPADEALSYTWNEASYDVPARCKAVTNYGVASDEAAVALTVYDTVKVDPRTGEGDAYAGDVGSAVSLAGRLSQAYSDAEVEFQWRVNSHTGNPLLKRTEGTSVPTRSGEYIELTPARANTNGLAEYADLALSDSWSASGEFWSEKGAGGASYVYVWANATPGEPASDQGQYTVAFDGSSDTIRLLYGAEVLGTTQTQSPIDNGEWRPFRVVFDRGVFQVYLDHRLRLESTDTRFDDMLVNAAANVANDLYGFGAHSGSQAGVHRVRRLEWATGTPVETWSNGGAEHSWTREGVYPVALTARVTTREGMILEGTAWSEVEVEAGKPRALPGGPYRGGLAGGSYSPIQLEGNHPEFVQSEDVGTIQEWVWLFPDESNASLEFDRENDSDDRVRLNPASDFPADAITVECWINTSHGGDQWAVSYADPNHHHNEVGIAFNAGSVSYFVHGSIVTTDVPVLDDGLWHHLALTWASADGASVLYVDGVEVFREVVAAGETIGSGGCFVLGQDQDSVDGGYDADVAFRGHMDDVMVWSARRTAEQILGDMDGHNKGSEEGLYLLWDFEGGNGETVVDQADSNRHVELVNMGAEARVAGGRPAVQRGLWNPTWEFSEAGVREVGLLVQSEFGPWSSQRSAQVTVVDGKVAGYVRAADQRTPVRDVRAVLTSSHVEAGALSLVAEANPGVYTTGDGGLLTDTDDEGYYEFPDLPLGSYRVRVSKADGGVAHEFKQAIRNTELALNAPKQLAMDFEDLSVFPVGGRVRYSLQKNGQDVYEEGVTVLAQPVGNASAIWSLPSASALNATGTNYSLPLFAGEYLFLAEKDGREILLAPDTPGYDPRSGLTTIGTARTNVDFVDRTAYQLTVQVVDAGGNPVALYPSHLSNAGSPIEVTVSGDHGQVSGAAVSQEAGQLGALRVKLNPGTYTVHVPGADPEEVEANLTAGGDSVSLTMPVKLELALSPRPRLLGDAEDPDVRALLDSLGLDESDNVEGYMLYYPPDLQTHTYTVAATANGEPVADFTLYLTDDVSMTTQDPAAEESISVAGSQYEYEMSAGLPRMTATDPPLAAPKRISFRAAKDGYADSDAVRDSVVVLGDVYVGGASQIVSIPAVNYTVLHDPPGDGSYSYLDDQQTVRGLVTGLKICANDVEVPLYPSPWSGERMVEGYQFGGSAASNTDVYMNDHGLLGYRDSSPTLGHFTWAAAVEGLAGSAIVASGPVGYFFQVAKLFSEASIYASVGRSAGLVQYEVSPVRRLETPSLGELPYDVGPGRGDIYFGEGWTLGLQAKRRLGLANANPDAAGAPDWTVTSEEIVTYDILERTNQYIYTTQDIEALIDDLDSTLVESVADSSRRVWLESARQTWEGLLNSNLAYRWDRLWDHDWDSLVWQDSLLRAPGDGEGETLIFSAGPVFEYARQISAEHYVSLGSDMSLGSSSEFSHELEVSAGFKSWFGGTEVVLKWGSSASIGSSTSFGASYESGQGTTQSVGFVLHDDDMGDNIAVRVYADPVWGTPIFYQEPGSITSDPWEAGTSKGIDVILELLSGPTGPLDYHDDAHYTVKVSYAGRRSLDVLRAVFDLFALPSENEDQVTVRFNGQPGPLDVGLLSDHPSAIVDVTVSPPEADLGNSYQKQYAVAVKAEESDDCQISRRLILSPTFADLRAPRATVVTPYDGQRISPVLFPAADPFDVEVVTEDTDVARIQLQIRGKQPDGVWEPWRNLTGMEWVDGADNGNVTVFDRPDRRPPRRELTFRWSEEQIRSLGVGEYALRAVAADSATTPNTDLDAPVVTFLVDETAPSVLTSLPDYQARESERIYRGELSVTFTDDMRGTDFDDRTFCVYDLLNNAERVSGYVSYSPALRKAVFVPVTAFQANGYYRVQVKTDLDQDGDGAAEERGVHDLAGNPLDSEFMWTFRTADTPFEPTWSMVLAAEDGVSTDDHNVAAVEYGALDGEDERDARAVPSLVSQLSLNFLDHDEVEYDRDVRPADGRLAHHWFLSVDNAAAGSEVTLWWTPSLLLTRSTRAYQVIRLVEYDEFGEVTNTIALDPALAGVNPETGLIDPVAAYTYTNRGEASRYFRLDVQRASSVYGTLTRGTSGWRFLSVPIVPQRPDPFVNLGDDIDPLQLFQYDPAGGGYWVYPYDLGDVALQTGVGYFTRLEEDAEVDVGGAANHRDVALHLDEAGWHTIGNPFILSVPVADLQVNDLGFDAAARDGLVEPTLYRWGVVEAGAAFLSDLPASDGYEAVTSGDVLETWEGYWLRTLEPGVDLVLPAPAGIASAMQPVPAYLQPPLAKPAAAPPLQPGEFDLNLALYTEQASDPSTMLGARQAARAGRDALDLAEPPTLGHTVAAYFTHPAWGVDTDEYNADYRPSLEVGQSRTWELTAYSEDTVPAMELRWGTPATRLPGDIALTCRVGTGDSAWVDMHQAQRLDLGRVRRNTAVPIQVRAERFELVAPEQVRAEPGETQVTLRWSADDSPNLAEYVVRRHPGPLAAWDATSAEVFPVPAPADGSDGEFVDASLAVNQVYTYQVAARYRTGAEATAGLCESAGLPAIATSALLQTYPNPGNPSVWLPYELVADAHVTIGIYNAAGQLVRALDVGHQTRGRYTGEGEAAFWDGRDGNGALVSSGVYLCQMKAGAFRDTRRAVILR